MKKTPVTFETNASFSGAKPGHQFRVLSNGYPHEYQLFRVETELGDRKLQWLPPNLDTEEAQVAYAKWKLSQ